MIKSYFLFLLLTGSHFTFAQTQKLTKSQLQQKKKDLEQRIQYLRDKMLYQEANSDEPAELYQVLRDLKKVNKKITALQRTTL